MRAQDKRHDRLNLNLLNAEERVGGFVEQDVNIFPSNKAPVEAAPSNGPATPPLDLAHGYFVVPMEVSALREEAKKQDSSK